MDEQLSPEELSPEELPADPPLAELPAFASGRFRMDAPSETGGHATVVRAWDNQLERVVACKYAVDPTAFAKMSSDKLDETFGEGRPSRSALADAAYLGRHYTLLHEARLLAMVDHPNVMPVLEVGRFGPQVGPQVIVLVLPYLGGGTVAGREFTGPWENVLEIAIQIARGLAALHNAGILHRDLKPNNILFDAAGRPRVADLGLSCRIDESSAMRERVGTAAYMPPGVFEHGFEDVRDDLYAFSMIAFEMFYGRKPFDSTADRDQGRIAKVQREEGMSPTLHRILVRGLAPKRANRWPNMDVLIEAMERVQRPAPRQPRWLWATAATATLAAGVALGVIVDESIAKADACENVMDELALSWNDHARSELVGAFGTRKAGDGLDEWATRWLTVRAQECAAAKDAEQPTEPTPCSASVRDRFQATVHAFRSPLLRRGLKFASVIAELPAPEHCLDHPDDADWGYGGLLELPNVDIEVEALVNAGDLELAHAQQADYMRRALEQGSELGVARATYFRAEIHRLEGKLDEAAQEFDLALERSIDIGLPVFTAECLLKLTAIAGIRGDMGVADAYALTARKLFARYRSERVAELLQVQGLALLTGSERERGVALLLQAVEMREEQLRAQVGAREWLSEARENYARGLLAVDRAAEAIEYLDLALKMHQEEFGHGTWRTRTILMQKFSALIELRRFDETESVLHAILNIDDDAGNWQRYTEDARWMAHGYESAGELGAAKVALLEGRAAAVEHELPDEIARFDLALGALMGE